MSDDDDHRALEVEIQVLEGRLREKKSHLAGIKSSRTEIAGLHNGPDIDTSAGPLSNVGSIHALLLLSDSALPLGSFAYSSGLESFLAHRKQRRPGSESKPANFQSFLHLSLSSVANTNLPYLLASYREPNHLEDLDNDLDASTPCTVARRASIAQGRALLGVWERSFRISWGDASQGADGQDHAAKALRDFSRAMKLNSDDVPITFHIHGHFAPIWGTTSRVMGLDAYQAAYVFLINHAKAVLSAAVRASVMGPYQAQSLLAGKEVQQVVRQCIEKVWDSSPEDAGQVVPSLDLWVGRHELLYSRIFNS